MLGHYFRFFYAIGKASLFLVIALFVIDILWLFVTAEGVKGARTVPGKMSNGDDNRIHITVCNLYRQTIRVRIIDEIPEQFQIRNFLRKTSLKPKEEKSFEYSLKPVRRGEYYFGSLNVYASTPIGFVSRRYRFDRDCMVPVYPSYIQMRKYELLAVNHQLTEAGIKKIRKIGRHTEFDQIRKYVSGDDYRTINWKATARKTELMANQYQEEKSQQVFNIIDMGRVMFSPFEGMTLLDYSINASLVISNVAVQKHDKAGLVTFSNTIHSVVPAGNRGGQMLTILEILYRQKTDFRESNYELLYLTVKKKIRQRSLLIIYTNFESPDSMRRQMTYLRLLAKDHLVLVIFFENSETKKLREKRAGTIEEIYIKTIAGKFDYEKRQIIIELQRASIHAIYTLPQNLTISAMNKYLEFKSRGMI